ncbi:hypothetical protein GEMMAAP_16015 [Gemmatimonas phototrophica]|uniref:Uncharacterized protein n=1 Tax=Gemmatimonas phototrophica TaxID=1379270 RepID=A0A143BMQ9_9BACT|nr:hypothetical protein GEMMAAP_16015 [Gemmatimonas phototrophica]
MNSRSGAILPRQSASPEKWRGHFILSGKTRVWCASRVAGTYHGREGPSGHRGRQESSAGHATISGRLRPEDTTVAPRACDGRPRPPACETFPNGR